MTAEKSIVLHADELRRLLAGEMVEVRRPFFELDGSRPVYGPGFPKGCAAWEGTVADDGWPLAEPLDGRDPVRIVCPFGAPGDQRWVRETLRRDEEGVWGYAADEMTVTLPKGDPRVPAMLSWAHHKDGDVCAANHMPRWASRLSVTITAVRCERSSDGQRWEWVLTARHVCPCEGEHDDSVPHIDGCRWSDPAHDEGSPL